MKRHILKAFYAGGCCQVAPISCLLSAFPLHTSSLDTLTLLKHWVRQKHWFMTYKTDYITATCISLVYYSSKEICTMNTQDGKCIEKFEL